MPRYTDRDPSAMPYQDEGPPLKFTRSRNRWPWLLGGLAVLLLLGCVLMGALLAGSGPNNAGLDEPVSTPSATKPTLPKPTAPAPKAKPKAVEVAEGGYYVGDDLPAGRYRTEGARREVITLCYWEVRTNGEPDGPIGQQGVVDSVGQQGDVTLRKGDYFKTTGCERWVKR